MKLAPVTLAAAVALGLGTQGSTQPASPSPLASPSPSLSTAMAARTSGGMMKVTHAVAVLHPTHGNTVEGTIDFRAGSGGVAVSATIKGLAAGNHGFHVHEFGDCTAPDATSAGGHFNPGSKPHGAPTDTARHAGDLGNVHASSDGSATLSWTDPVMRLDGPDAIVGRAMIVHANPDDFQTQPTGNAGGRVACGVIGVAKPE